MIIAYINSALDQTAIQLERATSAVDRALMEHRAGLLALAFVLMIPGACFNSRIAWTPLGLLLAFASIAIKRRLAAHPRRALALVILGYLVGIFLDKRTGRIILGFGEQPLAHRIARVYRDHTRIVLGVAMTVLVVIFALGYSTEGFIAMEASAHFIGCLVHKYITEQLM